jgi:hypothetical protein
MATPFDLLSDKYTSYTTAYNQKLASTSEPSANAPIKEGYTDGDEIVVYRLYNEMKQTPENARKYELDEHVTFPPTHPDFIPTEKEIMLNDSTQILNQQYNTMIITVAATASLGLIAFMVASTASSTNS